MMVDYCVSDWSEKMPTLAHCMNTHEWLSGGNQRPLRGSSGPLQIGGMAHHVPQKENHGWSTQPIGASLEGCIADLRIGGEVRF